jgi:hypothetical protein
MANFVPLLFDLLAERDNGPKLISGARFYGENVGDVSSMAESLEHDIGHGALEVGGTIFEFAEASGYLLEPLPFDQWVNSDGVGLPRLTDVEVKDFLYDIESTSVAPSAERWFEFSRLDDDTYLLFPNDASRDLRLEFVAPVRSSVDAVQFRRIDLGLTSADASEPIARGIRPTVANDRCVLNVSISESDRPYKGKCEDIYCGGACSPSIVYRFETGDYLLVGCGCLAET